MSSGQHVVIVDGVPETAAVLREVFEPRGHRVDRVRSFEPSPEASADTVLIVHDDGRSDGDRRFKYGTTPRIVIGSITTTEAPRGESSGGETACSAGSCQDERRLAQPFHYAELIRAVESMLESPGSQRSAA